MVGKVELIPIDEGNRITVKENEKVIVGRGSSLGVRVLTVVRRRLTAAVCSSATRRRSLGTTPSCSSRITALSGSNLHTPIQSSTVPRAAKPVNCLRTSSES